MHQWIPVVAFNNKGLGLTFARFLQCQGIQSRVEEVVENANNPQYQVFIQDPEKIELVSELAKKFAANPQAKEFQQAAWETGEIQESIKFGSVNFQPARLLAVPFTSLIMLLCLVIYISFFFGFFDAVRNLLSIQPLSLMAENHEWWRLFGPNFIHFSILHIAFNLLWWWILGEQLERVFGTFWLVVLFVISSLFANLSQLLATGPEFGGLSGVVYALFGFVWWIGWLRPKWNVSLPTSYIVFILVWLVLGFLQILPVNMANQAHLFGLVSGCLLALLLHIWIKSKQRA
ncbi:rhomboid family intramembrane serine protease GlpG [Glaciecola sp. 1036]|uniref:rhomboid family intramembrane serine protease GlpG n=1 Tax=Alteromonadaceae TaxID=72275 RepID=UPI003CFFD5A8